MSVSISVKGHETVAAWARGQSAPRDSEPAEFILQLGSIPPSWFWAALADGAIRVTNAATGDLGWGQDGIDLIGPNGTAHLELGETVRRSDVEGLKR